jgi:hypothetical protein
MKWYTMSWRRPSNRSARPTSPSGPVKRYFLVTSTIGRARRYYGRDERRILTLYRYA